MEERDRQTVNITSAHYGHSVDLRHRQRRYLVSMAIRTACFVAAVVADGPARWGFVVAAIFLPYIAVVLANNGSRRETQDAEVIRTEPIAEISQKNPDEQDPQA